MANWTSSTLLSRILELIDAETAISQEEVLRQPEVINSQFPTGSSLIDFVKEQVIKEAMKGAAHVHRPTKKAVKKAAPKEVPTVMLGRLSPLAKKQPHDLEAEVEILQAPTTMIVES